MDYAGQNLVFTLNVPANDGTDGAATDVSAAVGLKSVEISGAFSGSYIILGSHNGVNYVPLAMFQGGGDVKQTFSFVPHLSAQAGGPFNEATGVVVRFLKVRRRSPDGGVSITTGAGTSLTLNAFVAFATLNPGVTGPQAIVDLFTVVPPTGYFPGFSMFCDGAFSGGDILLEGSLDGVNFAPLAQFASQSLLPNGSPFAPVIIEQVTRYVRLNVRSGVTGPTTITLGGAVADTVTPSAGFGPISQDNVILTDGVAVTASRSDHRHTPFPTPDSFVVYAADYNGVTPAGDLLARPGYSLPLATPALTMAAALAAAVLTPFKTPERMSQLMTRAGNDATLVVLFKAGDYRNIANTADADWKFANNLSGWRTIVVRGSDWTNTAADKIICQGVTATGMNAAGYNAGVGSTAASLIGITLNGGGAPALPAEIAGFSSISSLRIRFDVATPTVALRNIAAHINKNGIDSVVPGTDLPAAPAVDDVFFIEQPGALFGSVSHNIGVNDLFQMTGVHAKTACSISAESVSYRNSFCTYASTLVTQGNITFFASRLSREEVGTTTVLTGMGQRVASATTHVSGASVANTSSGYIGRITVSAIGSYSLAAGSIAVAGVDARFSSGSNSIGTVSATVRPVRVTQATVSGISLGNGSIQGVDFGNCTGPLIEIRNTSSAQGHVLFDQNTSVDGGNTNVVLAFLVFRGNVSVCWGGGSSPTAALGDIRLQTVVNAAYCIATAGNLDNINYCDVAGNIIYKAGGVTSPTVNLSSAPLLNNDGTALTANVIMRSAGAGGGMVRAFADSVPNVTGIVGVCVTSPAIATEGLCVKSGLVPVNFGAVPTIGLMAYVSDVTPGFATTTAPAIAIPIGYVERVSGNFGYVNWITSPQIPAAGTVTSVTATAPLSSSGGATPDISHDDSAVVPDTYDSVTVDAKGHVTGGTNPVPAVFTNYPFSVNATAMGADSYFLANNGGVSQSVLDVDDGAEYPLYRGSQAQECHFWITDCVVTDGTALTISLLNLDDATSALIATIPTGSSGIPAGAALALAFGLNERFAVSIEHDGTAASLIMGGSVEHEAL